MAEFGKSLLVLGGARSGKSRHAQALAEQAGAEQAGAEQAGAEQAGADLAFIATAQAFDQEMTDRIARHRSDRDARWRTVEAPLDLVAAIRREDHAAAVILVDCLTLWVSNLLLAGADIAGNAAALCLAISDLSGRVILVSNEVGFGIVPDNALARRFRDAAGDLNQRVARVCSSVDLVVAGLPVHIKTAA